MELRERLLLLVLLHLRCCSIADTQLEPLGAAVFGMSAKSVPSSKFVTTEIALVVASLQMDLKQCQSLYSSSISCSTYAIVVTVKIRLALKLLAAGSVSHHGCTWVRVLPFRVVRFHVRFPIVAALE